jgi:hypothetical protein
VLTTNVGFGSPETNAETLAENLLERSPCYSVYLFAGGGGFVSPILFGTLPDDRWPVVAVFSRTIKRNESHGSNHILFSRNQNKRPKSSPSRR